MRLGCLGSTSAFPIGPPVTARYSTPHSRTFWAPCLHNATAGVDGVVSCLLKLDDAWRRGSATFGSGVEILLFAACTARGSPHLGCHFCHLCVGTEADFIQCTEVFCHGECSWQLLRRKVPGNSKYRVGRLPHCLGSGTAGDGLWDGL